MEPHTDGLRGGLARPTLEPLQQRVLELIAEGLSNSEAAEQLGIPVELARAHLIASIDTLGASSKLETLIIAVRHGLIRLPPR